MLIPTELPTDSPLWRVRAFGHERIPAGRSYGWNNSQRRPDQLAVIQLTVTGELIYRDETGETLVNPGQLLLFTHGENSTYHAPKRHTGYACTFISFLGVGVAEHLNALRRQFGSVIPDVSDGTHMARRIESLGALALPSANTPPTEIAHAVHAFFMELFDYAEQRFYRGLNPVERAITFILRRPLQPMSVEEVAYRFGCSREYLSRQFRQRMGETPTEFMTRAKVRRARNLLAYPHLSLKAVAEQSGFVSTRAMTRQLRAITGKSPAQIRQARPDANE